MASTRSASALLDVWPAAKVISLHTRRSRTKERSVARFGVDDRGLSWLPAGTSAREADPSRKPAQAPCPRSAPDRHRPHRGRPAGFSIDARRAHVAAAAVHPCLLYTS